MCGLLVAAIHFKYGGSPGETGWGWRTSRSWEAGSFFAKQNTSSSRFLCEVVRSKAGQDR